MHGFAGMEIRNMLCLVFQNLKHRPEINVDTFLSMKVFTKVAEAGNFAEAARRLKLSAPMVTRHIRSLEQRIGTRLINRTTHRFSLTEAGHIYNERCIKLIADIQDAESATSAITQLPRGKLRLSATPSFGASELWPVASHFMQKYPDISVDLVLTDRLVDLIEEEFDLAIRMAVKSLDPSLVMRKLAVSRCVPCASPRYLSSIRSARTPDDLTGHRCLAHGTGNDTHKWIFKRGGRTQTVTFEPAIQSTHMSLLRQAAIDGAGIVIQPSFNVWQDIAAGRLVTILDEWDAGELGVFAVFPSRKLLPVKTRLFIDFLAGAFRNNSNHDVWLERARSMPRRKSR